MKKLLSGLFLILGILLNQSIRAQHSIVGDWLCLGSFDYDVDTLEGTIPTYDTSSLRTYSYFYRFKADSSYRSTFLYDSSGSITFEPLGGHSTSGPVEEYWKKGNYHVQEEGSVLCLQFKMQGSPISLKYTVVETTADKLVLGIEGFKNELGDMHTVAYVFKRIEE